MSLFFKSSIPIRAIRVIFLIRDPDIFLIRDPDIFLIRDPDIILIRDSDNGQSN